MTSYVKSPYGCVKTILRSSLPLTLASASSALLLLLVAVGLSGCANKGYTSPVDGNGVSGAVIGGQNPVTGSTIQIYAVGSAGDGSAAMPLISATLTTSDGSNTMDSNANPGNSNNNLSAGSFTIPPGDYTCPSGSAEVYMVSKGGNPGLGTGVNANLTLMTGLGQCGNLSSSSYIVVNELTTVSSLAALSNFAASYSALGSGSGDASQLQAQFSEVNEYTNTGNGTVPGPTLPAGYSASSTAIQTLGDIVAACVNSAGGVAGDNSACGNLFSLATISGNPAPTDTVGAVINILNQPSVNVFPIFALLPANNPFEPTLSSAPTTWQLPITSSTATQLAFTAGPSSTAAGSPITSITVTIENASSAPQTSATNAVTLAIGANPSNGTLSGTTTVNAVNGVATFTGLNINKTGTGYTLTASATGLTGATSGTFNITPGAGNKLAFGVQPPASTAAGASMTPPFTVLVEDSDGNTVTTSTATVTLAIGANPASGTLTGTSANAVAGVATFSASSINNVGTGYTLAASSTGLTGATSNTFNITGSAITIGATTVGNNMITTLGSLSLPGAAPASEQLTLTSNDPTHFLLSTSSTAVGTASVTLTLTIGSSSIPGTVYVQGQNYSGTTAITSTITASASGFANGTGNLSLYPSGLGFNTSSFSTTTQAAATTLTIGFNELNPGTLTFYTQGNLGPQAPTLNLSVASGTTTTGTITGSPTTFPGGGAYYNQSTAFKPAGAGTSTLTITQPSGYYACSCSNWPLSIVATVNAPTMSVPTNSIVGNNLITSFNINLQTAPSASDTFTITSSDPTHLSLSLTAGGLGSASVSPTVGAGGSIPTIYLEGQNYSGTTAITANLTVTDSLNAYTPGNGTLSLYPSGLGFNTSSFSTTTQAAATTLTIGLNVLNPGTLTFYTQGNLGPQAPTLSFSVASGTTTTGTITGSPTTFPGGGAYYNQSTAFKPAGAGTSTLTITQPSGYSACSCTNWPLSITATVVAPTINAPTNTIVGNNLITSFNINLQTAPSASDTFTITSSDPTHLSLSLTAGGLGSASVSPTVGAGGSIPTIYLEGQNYSGTTAITANLTVTDSLNAYTPGSGTLSLYPSGLGFDTSSFSTTTFSAATTLTIGLNVLTPGTLGLYTQGFLGPQASALSFSVASGTTTTGTITGSPTTFPQGYGNYYNQATTFVPAGAGTSTITITQPSGYYACSCTSWPLSITATVSAPNITVQGSTVVGNELITGLNIGIQSAPPTSETMTITSNDPTHFLLSTSPTMIGSASVQVTLTANSTTVPPVYVEGQNFNNNATAWTTTVTASAPGYTTNSSGGLSLYPSGVVYYNGSSFNTTISHGATALQTAIVVLNPGSLTLSQTGMNLGPQAVGGISYTVTSGTLTTGTITGSPASIGVGNSYTNAISFVPAAVGTSLLTINQPSGFTVSAAPQDPAAITADVTGP